MKRNLDLEPLGVARINVDLPDKIRSDAVSLLSAAGTVVAFGKEIYKELICPLKMVGQVEPACHADCASEPA